MNGQSINEVFNPIRTKMGWDFGDPNSVLSRLKAARPEISQAPGYISLQNMVTGLQEKEYRPRLWAGKGGSTMFPNIQMQLGDEIIDIPFEAQPGHIFKGMKHAASKQLVDDRTAISFSEKLQRTVADMPAGLKDPGDWIKRKAINPLMDRSVRSAMHGGRSVQSRIFYAQNQVIFGEGHEYSVELQRISEQFGKINMQQYKGEAAGEKFRAASRDLEALYRKVGSAGYSVLGTKWETMTDRDKGHARMMAMNRNTGFTFYQGIMAGDPSKGFHQLTQRELIPHRRMKAMHLGRTVPHIQPRGYGQNVFETPMNIGILHPKLGTRLLGDSGSAAGSTKAMEFLGMFPPTETVTVQSRIVDGQVERAFSQETQNIFKRYKLDAALQQNQLYTFSKPIPFAGGEGAALGRGLGRTVEDKSAGVGSIVQAPKDMLLSAVKARRRGLHMEYEFMFEGARDVVDMSRTTILQGTTRLHVGRSLGIGGGKVDFFVRAQEFYGASLATDESLAGYVNHNVQNSIASRWLEMSSENKPSQTGLPNRAKIAQMMGLSREVKHGQISYTAGEDWVLTKERHDAVLAHMKGINPEFAAKAGAHTTPYKFSTKELNALLDDAAISNPVERQEFIRLNKSGGLLAISESSPVAYRSAMAGMKQSMGMKYRLDQMMTMLAQGAGGDPATRAAYMGQAEGIRQMLAGTSKEMLTETAGMYGPMMENKGLAGVQTLTREQYVSKFRRLPKLAGGIGEAALKGTILDPNRPAYMLDLGLDAPYYFGTDAELASVGGEKFTSIRKGFIPSSRATGVGFDGGGLFYGNRKSGQPETAAEALASMDELLRAPQSVRNARALGTEISAVHAAHRANMLGKAGMATPMAAPQYGSYQRLQHLAGGGENAYSVAMTESSLRAKFGTKEGSRIAQRIRGGESVFGEFTRWPIKETGAALTPVKIRLVKASKLAQLAGPRATFDNVLFAGRALMHLHRGDFDADAVSLAINMDRGAQKNLSKMNASMQGWLKFLDEQAAGLGIEGEVFHKFRPESELKNLASQWQNTVSESTAALHQVKTASPYPEVFNRSRRMAAKLMLIGSGGGTDKFRSIVGGTESAKAILRVANLDTLAEMKMTAEQYSAMDAYMGEWSQMATGKKETAQFALPEALYKSGQGGGNKPVYTALQEIEQNAGAKFRRRAHQFSSQSEMRKAAVEAFTMVESGMAKNAYIPTPYGAFYGDTVTKGAEAVAQATGSRYASEAETFAAQGVGAELAKRRGVNVAGDITKINQGLKDLAEGSGSHIKGRLGRKAIGGLRALWGSGWAGKAAIIGGAVIGIKGLGDAFTSPDSIQPAQAPLPPDIRMPQRQMAPKFAIPMADTRLERPSGMSYDVQGQVSGAYFQAQGLLDHLSTNIADTRANFGSVMVQNTPMTETDMEYFLRDKMRSDF